MQQSYKYLFYKSSITLGNKKILAWKSDKVVDCYKIIEENLQRRGPDYSHHVKLQKDKYWLFFAASLLHMQGNQLEEQPAVSSQKNVLLYNGEIFNGVEVPENASDTSVLLNLLESCEDFKHIMKVIVTIEGPWSLIYFQNSTKKLWFGRDYFGRRSLLMSQSSDHVTISSVACRPTTDFNDSWIEIPPGLYCLDLNAENDLINNISWYPWLSITSNQPKLDSSSCGMPSLVQNIPLISRISCLYRKPTLLFENSECREKILDGVFSKSLEKVCDLKKLWEICRTFISKLENAVARRTKLLNRQGSSKVGILFSGGIDCTVLAFLAHNCLPEDEPIDLLNVAFEQRKSQSNTNFQVADFNVPDRVTGISSLQELRRLCPNRRWNFVKIDIKVEELREFRAVRIADLAYPKQTVLDDSIACAIWFASRGKGTLLDEDGTESAYHSSVRILLCGMGADEQLGGYARHRTVFQRLGDWKAVKDEIDMEIERISFRNLGRDDRIVSDHGREARFPYIDEEVVGFLLSLPIYQKTDFRYPRGVGEKILLRGAAYLLGFRDAAVLPKRAIQFGSRIAKAENEREKGSDACRRLIG